MKKFSVVTSAWLSVIVFWPQLVAKL